MKSFEKMLRRIDYRKEVNMMTYRVHLASRGDVNYRFDASLDPNSWLTNGPEVVYESDTIEDAETMAYSYLGRDSDDTAYISCDDGRLIKSLRCAKADEERSKLSNRIAYLAGFAVLCCLAFLVGAVFGRAGRAFLVFAATAVQYTLCVTLKIQNVPESFLVALIFEVLIFLLLPAADAARAAAAAMDE